MNLILDNLKALPPLEWFAWATAIIYVFLAAKESIWCWYFGIASCSAWTYITFDSYQLYLDAILQIFYVVMGFWGIYSWKYRSKANEKSQALPISRLTNQQHIKIIVFGSIVSIFFGFFFDKYTPAAATYLDSFTTIFAIITTYLVIQKKLENWLYWIVIDLAYLYLYQTRGAFLFSSVMLIYIMVAISGYFKWKKSYFKTQSFFNNHSTLLSFFFLLLIVFSCKSVSKNSTSNVPDPKRFAVEIEEVFPRAFKKNTSSKVILMTYFF